MIVLSWLLLIALVVIVVWLILVNGWLVIPGVN